MTRESRLRDGICVDCKEPATITVRCDEHAKLNRDRQRPGWRDRALERLEMKRARGLCADCLRPVVVGKTRCFTHLERARLRVLKYKTREAKAEHIEEAPVPRFTALDRKLSALGRCSRCNLLLPCGPCLPTIQEVAMQRFGAAGGET
jgi:hypothetical protein